jgi:hypothetical protein
MLLSSGQCLLTNFCFGKHFPYAAWNGFFITLSLNSQQIQSQKLKCKGHQTSWKCTLETEKSRNHHFRKGGSQSLKSMKIREEPIYFINAGIPQKEVNFPKRLYLAYKPFCAQLRLTCLFEKEVLCGLPLQYVNEEFNIDSTNRNFTGDCL